MPRRLAVAFCSEMHGVFFRNHDADCVIIICDDESNLVWESQNSLELLVVWLLSVCLLPCLFFACLLACAILLVCMLACLTCYTLCMGVISLSAAQAKLSSSTQGDLRSAEDRCANNDLFELAKFFKERGGVGTRG
jgi:hypothetical protein